MVSSLLTVIAQEVAGHTKLRNLAQKLQSYAIAALRGGDCCTDR
ncbi:hypothetical protein J2X85_004222 [Microbacterium trichothecenolyticum]|nr:hypothetical protein [Microbacterium trichothecenolyticum]